MQSAKDKINNAKPKTPTRRKHVFVAPVLPRLLPRPCRMEQELGSVAAAARAAATAAAQTAVAATAQAAVEPAVVAMAMAMGAAAPEPKERMSEGQTGGARPKGEEEDVPRRKPVCTQESVQALANFQRLTKGTGAQGLHPLPFRGGLGLLGHRHLSLRAAQAGGVWCCLRLPPQRDETVSARAPQETCQ